MVLIVGPGLYCLLAATTFNLNVLFYVELSVFIILFEQPFYVLRCFDNFVQHYPVMFTYTLSLPNLTCGIILLLL